MKFELELHKLWNKLKLNRNNQQLLFGKKFNRYFVKSNIVY